MKKILLIASLLTSPTSQAVEINTLESNDKPSYPKVNYDADKNIYRIKFKDSQSFSEDNSKKDIDIAHIDEVLLELETRHENDKKMKDKHEKFIMFMYQQNQERERKARELAKKPNPKIGMTKKQVLNDTNWGEPNGIRTFITAKGAREVWTYNTYNNYKFLYFDSGKLTMIEQ